MKNSETLLEIAKRGMAASQDFLKHLTVQSAECRRLGRDEAADRIDKVRGAVKELLDFERATADRMEAETSDDDIS